MKNPFFVPKKNSFVRSNHFEENCFDCGVKRGCLLNGSKPTLFSNNDAVKQVFKNNKIWKINVLTM